MLDAEYLLRPVSEGNACGDALDYDLSFLEFEMASQGRPAQHIGGSLKAEEAPNWEEVWRLGLDLATRTKDLRIGVLLTRSAVSRFGFSGLAKSLELLVAYVEIYWPELHPRPDADDGGDQTVRLNALANLCDPSGLMADIRRVPLTASRRFGAFALGDWMSAQQSQPGEVDTTTIKLAFGDTDPGQFDQTSGDLDASLSAVIDLDGSVKRRVDMAEAVRFQPLTALLRQGKELVDAHRRSEPVAAMPLSEDSGDAPYPGEIRDRDDVVNILGRVCRWYQVNEPASPVPALLERAKRLVSKDFMALVAELAPEGAAHYRSIAGLIADEGT
ncbi:type VI secretion system protein TssA [Mesorhizobium waimense]|uniref:Type VI secretion system protein TssA n=1 Tax=Mesorhizobium waimense TaxID=1300307 RepID=A0A3A5K500_9HYPH|nr:type VI secretion system protein TssA [Mesorhizobium waimense]RJT29466.1 type VI secretion system protein TssA [Mesorhizobium waimense]